MWWVDYPAVLGLFGAYVKLFDKGLWKFEGVRSLPGLRVSDLSGVWVGTGRSLYQENGESKEFECELTIRQEWTTMCVWLDTKTSESQSLIGGITVGGRRPILSYEYFNEPEALAPAGMNAHRGVTRLELTAPDRLKGEYYSGRGRQTFGALTFRRRV